MFTSSNDNKKSMQTLEKISSIQQDSLNNLLEVRKLADNIVKFNEGTLNNLLGAILTNSKIDLSKDDKWQKDTTA